MRHVIPRLIVGSGRGVLHLTSQMLRWTPPLQINTCGATTTGVRWLSGDKQKDGKVEKQQRNPTDDKGSGKDNKKNRIKNKKEGGVSQNATPKKGDNKTGKKEHAKGVKKAAIDESPTQKDTKKSSDKNESAKKQEPPTTPPGGGTGVTKFKARTIAAWEEEMKTDEDYQAKEKVKQIGKGSLLIGGAALLIFSLGVIFNVNLSSGSDGWAVRTAMEKLDLNAQVLASLGDPIRTNMGRRTGGTSAGTFEFGGDTYTRTQFPVTGSYNIQGICLVELKQPGDGGPAVISYLEVTIPTQGKVIKVIT